MPEMQEFNYGPPMDEYAQGRGTKEKTFRRVLFGGGSNAVSVMDQAAFILLLNDLGAGAVNTTLQKGTGAATFTNATSRWTKLASGLWGSVASGVARSCYLGANTAVGAYGGYFAEAAGTQLVTPTASIRDMTQAAWIKVTMTTAFTSTGIDGVASSCTRLTATGANSTILQTLVAAATSRTYSCWVKRITGSGTVLLKQGTATLDITALINSSTFTLVQLNDNELNVAFGLQINTSGDAIDVDFNQFEAGAFATSPMDAAGAVRNLDVLNYPASGNFGTTEGTLYSEAAFLMPQASIGTSTLVTFSAAIYGAGNGFLTRIDNNISGEAGGSGTSVGGNFSATSQMKFVGAYKISTTRQAACGNGGTVGSNATLDFTGVGTTNINIGSLDPTGLQAASTLIKNVRIWTTQLSDATLQAITA